MKNIKVLKTVTSIVLTIGVSNIISNVIKATTPAPVGMVAKLCIGASGMVLANMTTSKANEYIEETIDDFVCKLNGVKVIDV